MIVGINKAGSGGSSCRGSGEKKSEQIPPSLPACVTVAILIGRASLSLGCCAVVAGLFSEGEDGVGSKETFCMYYLVGWSLIFYAPGVAPTAG